MSESEASTTLPAARIAAVGSKVALPAQWCQHIDVRCPASTRVPADCSKVARQHIGAGMFLASGDCHLQSLIKDTQLSVC